LPIEIIIISFLEFCQLSPCLDQELMLEKNIGHTILRMKGEAYAIRQDEERA